MSILFFQGGLEITSHAFPWEPLAENNLCNNLNFGCRTTCTHKRTCSFQQNFYEKETFFVFVFLSIYLSLLNFQETMNTTMIPKIPKIVFMSVHPAWMLFFLRLKSSKPKEKVLLNPIIYIFFVPEPIDPIQQNCKISYWP